MIIIIIDKGAVSYEHKRIKRKWLSEEENAHIHGWDFSYLDGRFESSDDDLDWDYRKLILDRISPDMRILDIDTGGGEFLLSLGHPHNLTSATEGYPPNVELCRERLIPLGVDFRPWQEGEPLPFDDESFDMVINRHGSYEPSEIFRVLKKGGIFITQQVGGDNDRELSELLCPDRKPLYQGHCLKNELEKFVGQRFTVTDSGECFRPIEFYDALVWFARVIPWEFSDFSVENNFDRLCIAQEILEKEGCVRGHIHRFMIIAVK